MFTEVCRSGCKFLDELLPGAQFVLDHGWQLDPSAPCLLQCMLQAHVHPLCPGYGRGDASQEP